jgi:hypothetical protein
MSHCNRYSEAQHAHRLAYALRSVMVSLEATNGMSHVSGTLQGMVASTIGDYFSDDHSELNYVDDSPRTDGPMGR